MSGVWPLASLSLFSTTLHMNLSGEFDAAFQVFLLSLLLSLTMENLEDLTRY
jgi:hypothetical protein